MSGAARHVVSLSGGIASWETARRVVEDRGLRDAVLLFADTRIEDPDLYRFLADVERDLDVPVTRIAEGRTPWEVFRDERMIGNSRVDPCSKLLKRRMIRRWLRQHAGDGATLYVGIDWTEEHRLPAIRAGYAPLAVAAPLTERPYEMRDVWLDRARTRGLEPPRLYAYGFAHNNCGGTCIKAGQAQWARVLAVFPERYAEWERQEEAMRARRGRDVAILRERRGGETRPLTLRAFRQRLERDAGAFDRTDWGACGCFAGADLAQEGEA